MSEYRKAVKITKKAKEDIEQRPEYRFGPDVWRTISENVWPNIYSYILSLSEKGISYAKIHYDIRTKVAGRTELIEFIKTKGFRVEDPEIRISDMYDAEFIVHWDE